MAKYDFQNCMYSKLWDSTEGRVILSTVLNDPDLIRANFTFWSEKFLVDPSITPANADGTATYISRMRKPNKSYMMHMRAPLGDTVVRGNEGAEYNTGVIPDFISDGLLESAVEREYKERMFIEQFGNDSFLVSQFIDEVQSLVDGADQTLSYMAAQLLSTGKTIYDKGEGVSAIVNDNKVPAENFVKAGEKAWTDPTCKIFDQMAKIEETFRDKWGLNIPMRWEIPYQMFKECFLPNEQVIEWVRYAKSINNVLLPEKLPITKEMFDEAMAMYEGVSPIYIVEEKQRDVTGMVHGWDDKAAVLRPDGYAGYIRHSPILDTTMYTKYGSSVISRSFATSANNLYTIMNSVHNNGNLKEWHTSLMMKAVPSLDQFLYHVIVDTKSADD